MVAPFAGRLTVRVKSRYLLGVGMLLITGGLLLMTTITADSAWTVLLPGFIVAGIGIGMVNPVLASASISVVEPQRSGMASGTNNTFRQVGIATGIAVLGADLPEPDRQPHLGRASARRAIGRVGPAPGWGETQRRPWPSGRCARSPAHPTPRSRHGPPFSTRITSASPSTLNHLMIIGAIVAFVGVVGGFALVRQRDFVVPGGPGGPGGPSEAAVPDGPGGPAGEQLVTGGHA